MNREFLAEQLNYFGYFEPTIVSWCVDLYFIQIGYSSDGFGPVVEASKFLGMVRMEIWIAMELGY